MLANQEIIYQPAFYFLLAVTILLTLTYRWGRTANQRLVRAVFDPLLAALKARDQEFTNIGGLTGYHATIRPGNLSLVKEVKGTLTLLPRQSLLYVPIALLFGRRDRLVMAFALNKRGRALSGEGHLIRPAFEKRPGNHIENAALSSDDLDWGGETVRRYWSDDQTRARLEAFAARLESPGIIQHIALVPEQDRVWVVLAPRRGQIEPVYSALVAWLQGLEASGDGDAAR